MQIRQTNITDHEAVRELYKTVARISGGIARKESENSDEYIQNFMQKSLKNGVELVAEDNGKIVGEVHSYSFGIDCFKHTLGDTTICIHPDYQGIGLGKKLFSALLEFVAIQRKDILRVELHARSTNKAAIAMYQKIGFEIEGQAKGRVLEPDGSIVADVPMAWLNPNFIQHP